MNLSQPPVLVGERIFWLGSGSGLPKPGLIRWIGHLPEIGQEDWTVGIELDEPLPYGGIDGAWGHRVLFVCKQKHGLLVPITQIAPAFNLKFSKHQSDSLRKISYKENNRNNKQSLIQSKKRHSTGGFLGTQERQLAGTSVRYADQQGPLPAVRKKYQQQILTPNEDGENYVQEKRIINIPPSRCRKLELKYKKDEEINNRNIILDDVSDNEKLYDCYSKFDTLRADEKADLLLSKCLERGSKKKDTIDVVDKSNDGHIKRMLSNYQTHIHSNSKHNNHNVNNNNIVIQSHQSDSHLESITVSDTVFAARRQIFYKNGRSHSDETHTAVISSSISSSSSSRKEKSASGIFSFFRWFKKDKEGEEEDDDDVGLPSAPASPRFIRSQSSSCGSVDTLFSTATANSFAFIHPAYYRPFGSAHQAETRITDSPETHTYRQRLLERERRRELEKDVTLKKKYNLFGSSTIYKSADDIPRRSTEINKSSESLKHVKNISPASRSSTINRKKRKAPPPPVVKEKLNDYSLPNTLEHLNKSKKDNENAVELNCDDTKPHHRRTVSESAKDKKAGAYCHVRGKRKAPPPPVSSATADNTTNVNKIVVQSSQSLGKKKRPAPQPPVNTSITKSNLKSENIANISLSTNNSLEKGNLSSEKEKSRGSLSPEDKERLLKNIAKLQAVADRRSSICTPPSSPSLEQRMSFSISNDSLKLERGVLKSTKSEESTSSTSPENKFTPSSPVSPRPWYKRNIIKDHGLSNGKLFDKKKEKTKMEDWMPEVGIPRTSLINTNESGSKFNIFSKPEKNEEKRKSQISMLVNISELDREAAEIVQKEHAKEKAILAAEDAKFYTFPEDIGTVEINKEYQTSPNVEVPKRSSAKELISLFNAITNVTKVTVNTSFFSKEGSSLFSREGKEKRFSFGSSATSVTSTNDMNKTIQTTQEKYIMTQNVITSENNDSKKEALLLQTQQTYIESPGETRRRWNKVDVLDRNDDENDDTIVINDFNTDIENATGSRVTIEEIDEFDIDVERSSKTQALYEANRLRRHHSPSPSIPTIVEQSESASSVTTSPGSTSTRSQKTTTPTTPTTTFQQTITPLTNTALLPSQQNKRPTSIWACPQCTLENPRWRLTCEACDMWKPPLHSTNNKQINDPPINKNKSNDLNHIIESNSKEKNAIDNLNEFQKNNDKTIEKSILVNTNMEDAKHNTANKNAEKENSDNIVKEEKQKLTEEKFSDIDELRKARLAFFHKSSNNTKEIQTSNDNETDETQNKPINTNSISSNNNINNIESEQAKLKEMLKDLKHSLPKRHKKSDSTEELDKNTLDDRNNNRLTGHDEVKQNRKEEITPAVKNLGAIKKIPHTKVNQSKCDKTNYNNINHEEEKAEIYLVKTETIIEDVKVKKQLTSGIKPEKISTSVQTGAIVCKAESQQPQGKLGNGDQIASKPPLGKLKSASPLLDKKEMSIPITIEEYTIKDGVLYTSLSKEKQKIGTGTFELILAHDFAGIKATKTSKDATKLPTHHVYANVPNSEEEGNDDKKVNHINSDPESVNVNMNNEKAVEKLTVQLTQPKGLADFKAGLEFEAASAAYSGDKKHTGAQMMNTLAVNRLLRRLETAISKGQLKLAAKLAKELAQMKINCSVTRHKTIDDIVVDMYVEDKVSHQGPISLMISPNFTVAQLKLKVEREFEIPVAVQRWILGKQLAADDTVILMDVGINTPHCPIFLYLVAPEMGQERTSVIITTPENSEAILPSTSQPVPPPPPENVKRGGWYYNDEEDKYSFCEDTESELSDVSQPDTPHSLTDDNNEDLASEYSENEIAEEQDERPPTPPERNIEIEEAQPPLTPTGTLALGWKCELCTLINSPTRPGCAACTSPRPQNYHVPQDYQVSQQELQRIRQEELQQEETAAERLQNYQALVDLENTDVVLNTEQFECPICFLLCAPQDGVILRDCLHTFCRGCLINTVQFNEEAVVKCPYRDTKYACDSVLLEREIKALVPPDVYEQHLAKSVAEAENKIGNAFHCKTPDCPGWCIFEDNVNEFLCPVCKHTNCLTCQAIHAGINCKQFQERAKQDSETNADARRTNEMLEEMVDRGEAMKCPTCQVILMKKWGCDWLRCSMCKTEICWVTRGPRWGPLGKGDTSGGCQCGVNGIKCHPKCNYCH